MRNLNVIRPFLYVTLFVLLAGCGSSAAPTPQLILPTAAVTADITAVQATPTPGLPPAPTMPPSSVPDQQPDAQPTAPPTPQPTTPPVAAETQYRVAFVTADDTLNVRSGPGVANGIIGELAPDAGGVQIIGSGQMAAGSTWVPIAAGNLTGWVNSRYLTATVDNFCADTNVPQLLGNLETAVANQNGDQLAQLIHPERGLRLHHSWWNPEIYLTQADARSIFTSSIPIDWGVQDGSGNPIVGPFKQEILPLLQQDLLPASESSCDDIIHGGTAGWVRLPDGHEAVHFYALHRPGTEEFAEMDWGTWVVGIEKWQGNYYLSYLVHYQWEI